MTRLDWTSLLTRTIASATDRHGRMITIGTIATIEPNSIAFAMIGAGDLWTVVTVDSSHGSVGASIIRGDMRRHLNR